MQIYQLAAPLAGTPSGPTISNDDAEKYLANIPYPVGGSNANHRFWSGERSFAPVTAGSLTWKDRIGPGERLTSVSGTTAPTKTTAINSRQTLTFATTAALAADTFELDADRNTIYALVKPGSTSSLTILFGPLTEPTPGSPTDDVLSLGWTSGRPRLLTDAGNASLIIGSDHDYRGEVVLFTVTMSPEHGKALWVNGVENVRNAGMTSSLTVTDFIFGSFGDNAGKLDADVECLLILPGQDMSDSYFTAANAAIHTILKARGGI